MIRENQEYLGEISLIIESKLPLFYFSTLINFHYFKYIYSLFDTVIFNIGLEKAIMG